MLKLNLVKNFEVNDKNYVNLHNDIPKNISSSKFMQTLILYPKDLQIAAKDLENIRKLRTFKNSTILWYSIQTNLHK